MPAVRGEADIRDRGRLVGFAVGAQWSLRDAVDVVLIRYSHYANLTFTEITETSSVHADIRFAVADISANRGYFPGDVSAKSGDIWLSASEPWSTDAVDLGNRFCTERAMTVMHEVGHSLGLSHPGLDMDPSPHLDRKMARSSGSTGRA